MCVADHDKWKELNLAATVLGWQCFKPLHDRHDNVNTATASNGDLV
jgi:hypothetical protein